MNLIDNQLLAKKRFLELFVITLLFKILISVKIPITGDEALFVVWARDLSWGYYDHPPMIAWVLAFFSFISSDLFVIRLPATLSNHIIALGIIYLLIQIGIDKSKVYLAAMVYLLLPISLLNVLVTNDTSLLIFLFGSIFFFNLANLQYQSFTNKYYFYYFLSGIFFGSAFLSKYLAVIFLIPFLFIFIRDLRIKEFLIFTVGFIPFLAINLIWNANNCWQNVQFNLVNRLEDKVTPWFGISSYLLIIAYVITPWFIYFIFKNRARIKFNNYLSIISLTPLLVFGFLSFRQLIGLHWMQPLIPGLIIFGSSLISIVDIRKVIRWNLFFSANHIIVILLLIFVPIKIWEDFKIYPKFSLLKYSNEVSQKVYESMPSDSILMTKGYSTSSIFSFYLNQKIPVFGVGSKFGRHDDLNFDFKSLDGKSIRIFDNSSINVDEFKPFFSKVTLTSFDHRGVQYWYVDGDDFNYATYRNIVLNNIAERFYRFPQFLPPANCWFLTNYGINHK